MPSPCKTAVNDELLTLRAASEACGVSISTIRRRIASGKLPYVRMGRLLYVRRCDLSMLFESSGLSGDEILRRLAKSVADGAPKLSESAKLDLVRILCK